MKNIGYTSLGISVARAFSDRFSKNMLRCLSFITLSLLFILSSLTAVSAQVNETESLELRVVTLEQQFDTQVLNVLSNYFDTRKFFVDINIDAQFVDDTYRTTENLVTRGGQQYQQENVMMPGLPFLPEENLQPREVQNRNNETTQTVINEHTIQRLQILELRVNVYADSSFSADQVEFMRLIAGIAAKINESRGDLVNVRLINMPDFGITELPPARVTGEESQETLLGSIKDYIPGFVLLLLLGLTLLVGRLTQNPSKKEEEDSNSQHFSRSELKQNQNMDSFQGTGRFDAYNRPAENLENYKPQKSSTSDLTTVTDQILNNSKDVALLFEFWMEEEPLNGAKKAAKAIKTIDGNLLKALKRDLDQEAYTAIEAQLESMDELSVSQKKVAATEFLEALDRNTRAGERDFKHQQLGLFQFLDHLDPHHVQQLLLGEDRDTCALLIDYLPDGKAAKVLERFDKDRVTEVMMGMSNLNQLSYSDHKHISSRLFSKAMDILEVDRELKQGSKNILRVLNQLPLEDQDRYLEQLKASGSPVADVIAKNFITLEQIPELDEQLLKTAIASLPTEILLNAISDLSEPIANKLLSVRPKREQRLIKMEIQQMENIDKEKSEIAKTRIMEAIRKIA
jgi:flagellar motor switch protein FliG